MFMYVSSFSVHCAVDCSNVFSRFVYYFNKHLLTYLLSYLLTNVPCFYGITLCAFVSSDLKVYGIVS